MKEVLFKRHIPLQWNDESPRKRIEGTGKWEDDFTHRGLFHQWGSSYEEYDVGPANYTIAIIELPDGTIEEVLPSNIKFIQPTELAK